MLGYADTAACGASENLLYRNFLPCMWYLHALGPNDKVHLTELFCWCAEVRTNAFLVCATRTTRRIRRAHIVYACK